MMRPPVLFVLMRHAYRVWRAGQIRFRLETFGLYYPQFPYSAPWWKVSPRLCVLLVRRLRAYAQWVADFEELAKRERSAVLQESTFENVWSRLRGIGRSRGQ